MAFCRNDLRDDLIAKFLVGFHMADAAAREKGSWWRVCYWEEDSMMTVRSTSSHVTAPFCKSLTCTTEVDKTSRSRQSVIPDGFDDDSKHHQKVSPLHDQ